MNAIDPVVRLTGVHKRYGPLEVLSGLDLQIPAGRVTAVVGHNGSGKTTLIKCLLGLVKPDAGSIEIFGEPINGEAAYRDRIGYMAQAARFPDNLTATDLFGMMENVRGRPGERRGDLIELFRLDADLRKPLRTLSGGTAQKVSAVIAFMFAPDLLILDEPTAGLDPLASSVLKDLVRVERAKGRTIILTSHVMSEIEELSDRIVFLRDGLVGFEGDVGTIRRDTGQLTLERAVAHIMQEEICVFN